MSALVAIPSLDVPLLHRIDQPSLLLDYCEWWWKGRRFRHKKGGYTDGMSSPQFLHAIRGAEDYGWNLFAAQAHDGGYHDDLEECVNGVWVKVTLKKSECDSMFYDLCLLIAAGNSKRVALSMVFYQAVHLGGLQSFNEARERAAKE